MPLLALAGRGHETVRWYVGGQQLARPRWTLVPGVHTIRAVWSSGQVDSVRIVVD